MIKLNEKSLKLLMECLKNHNPSLIPFIKSDSYHYTADFYNELREIVGDELCEKGFQPNSEPNEYGLKLEGLIDEIGRLFITATATKPDYTDS